MSSITAIRGSLPGERVISVAPEDRTAAAATWLRRPNLFPGRALTAPTLEARSRWSAGRVTQRGQAFTPGVVRGLGVGYVVGDASEGGARASVRLHLSAGQGLAAGGEDVVIPRDLSADLWALPVVAPPAVLEGGGFGGGDVLQPRAVGASLGALLDAFPGVLPRAAVLVLQPASVEVADVDPDDPCDRCGCGEAGDNVSFEDWRYGDAVRLLWYAWPEDWRALPALNARFRNRLAYTVFDAERTLEPGAVLPWEEFGVPVALFGLGADMLPSFVDHTAVVRRGGRARTSRLLIPAPGSSTLTMATESRLPALWQAQIEQLAEQVAGFGDPAPDARVLADSFERLPPCGLLPRNVMDVATRRSDFFPASMDLDAVPVPMEQLDLALRDAAGMAPLDLTRGERVRILVPVSQASWEPRLLLTEEIDPEFQATLDRFLLDRGRALAGRQGVRLKSHVILEALRGEAPPVPAISDDPLAVEPETLGAWGPPEGALGGHRSGFQDGVHDHGFSGAADTLTPEAGDSLYTWINLDPEHPPRTLMLEWRSGRAEHRAYWGDNLIERGSDGRVTRLRMGDLPETGRWLRLDVPAATMEFEGSALDGMGFVLYDGRAAFGPSGRVSGGEELRWFDATLPGGAEPDGSEAFERLTPDDLLAPFEERQGVVPVERDGGTVDEVSETLTGLEGDPRLTGVLSESEMAQLPARGVEGFIAYLKARADRADDLIDYGFLKVQTDIYRVRQLVLGTTDATRLAVSPALAGIAKAETAVASQESISTFFDRLRGSKSTQAAAAATTEPAGGAAPTGGSSAPSSGSGTSSGTFRTFGFMSMISQPSVNLGIIGEAAKTMDFSATKVVRSQTTSMPLLQATAYTPLDITNSAPLVGSYNVRTLSIAQRLELPKAKEARDYSTATRHEAVLGLIRLADKLTAEDGEVPGLFDGIDVWGLDGDAFIPGGEDPVAALRRPFKDFLDVSKRATLMGQLLTPPIREQADEASHFSDSADLADRTVALLRQIEGRVKLYRDAIDACASGAEEMHGDLSSLSARERAWGEQLAEARHDVAVTRALIAEEQDRLDAINQRRAEVLDREVRFLAYARPRAADNLSAVASRPLDPGLLDAPAPACLRERDDVPDALRDMLAVVREAPSDWFRLQRTLLDGLDRVDLLVGALQTARLRAERARSTAPVSLSGLTGLAAAIGKVHQAQRDRVNLVRTGTLQLNISHLATLSWQGVRAEAAKVVSLGDLIDGEHGQVRVTRNAAAFFERFGRICGCLHAGFSEVLPAIRLDWAEVLSQFDEAPNLRNLSSLPRWSEVDYVLRRRLQGLTDWLFDQLDPRESRAQALVNDVVRMCLLLASHAPVGRIIAGRLPRPVTARPGIRIPLVPLDPARLRVGMHAVVYRGSTIVARGVVEDMGPSEAAVRVTHTAQASVDLDETARVHFAAAATLGVSATMSVWRS